MPFVYTLEFESDVESWHQPLNDIVETVNKFMKSFGFDEKMAVRGQAPFVQTITSDVLLEPSKVNEFGVKAIDVYNQNEFFKKMNLSYAGFKLRIDP